MENFRVKVLTDKKFRQEIYKKIIDIYQDVELDKEYIYFKGTNLALKIIKFINTQNQRIIFEIADNDMGIVYQVESPENLIQVQEILFNQLVDELKDKTIFDNDLSIRKKRILLKRVPKDSKFRKSFNNYLEQIANWFVIEIPDQTVTLHQISNKYIIKSDVQSGIPEDAQPSKGVDLRLLPLEISDIKRIKDLVNKKKKINY